MRCAPRSILRLILLVAAAASAVACRRASYCETVCSCGSDSGCFQGALVSCEAQATGDKEASQELGCSKEYDALATCLDDTALCFKYPWTVQTSCDVQQNVWNKCMAAAQGK